MELLRYWEIIRRRKWLIIITFLIFFLTIVVGTHIITPTYEGKTKILMDYSDTLSALMGNMGLSVQGAAGAFEKEEETYDTAVALATRSPLLDKFISALSLQNDDEEPVKPSELLNCPIYSVIVPRPCIAVERYEETNIIEITASAPEPEQAAEMANTLAKLYIEDRIKAVQDEVGTARKFLERNIAEIKRKYRQSLMDRKDYMILERSVDLKAETAHLLTYISELKDDYKNNDLTITGADEEILLLEEKIGGKAPGSSSVVNNLQSTLNDLIVESAGMSIDFSSEHPDVVLLNKKIESVKNILRSRADIVISQKSVSIGPVYDEMVRNLMDAYLDKHVGEIRKRLLQKYIDSTQEELLQIPLKSLKESEIELSLSANETLYQDTLENLSRLHMAESMAIFNMRLIESAPVADEPIFPNKGINYSFGILLGLFWGLFLCFFIEYIETSLKGLRETLKQTNE